MCQFYIYVVGYRMRLTARERLSNAAIPMGALLLSTSTTPRNLLRLRGVPWLIRRPAARQAAAVIMRIVDMALA
jgi:hypothetical protein